MSSQDALWLKMDRPNNLMVIDTIMWFNNPLGLDAVREVVLARMVNKFPVMQSVPQLSESENRWVIDENFDLDNHLQVAQLPEPADFAALQAWVGSQRQIPFDHTKPLWTMTVLDNFKPEPDRLGSAIMVRTHHALADGVRLTQVMVSLCDLHSEPVKVGRDLAAAADPKRVAISALHETASATLDIVTSSSKTVLSAGKSIADTAVGSLNPSQAIATTQAAVSAVDATVRKVAKNPALLSDAALLVSSSDNKPINDVASAAKLLLAPRSVTTAWSGTPGLPKSVTWAPMISLAEVKQIRRATGTTVNDVLLGAVAGALTRYLAEHGESLTEVMWLVPVSVRPFDPDASSELGNHFALVALRMPLDISDIPGRIQEIHRRMARIKSSHEPLLTYAVQLAVSKSPEPVATGLTNYFANKGVGVLTNVPGPQEPIYFASQEVAGMLGWAPCSGDQPMNICIFSYNGKVAVGFGADSTLIPDSDRLSAHFAEEFKHMRQAFGISDVPIDTDA